MAATQKQKTAYKTTYVVLRHLGEVETQEMVIPDVWAEVGRIEANSGPEAIRHLAQKLNLSAGSYVAPPERSWKPTEGGWETEPRFVIKGQTTIAV